MLNTKIKDAILPLIASLPLREIKDPIFILGCGRSGTSILSRSLALHPEIVYWDEPREIWKSCYPKSDIWSNNARRNKGKLVLEKEDESLINSRRLRRLFALKKSISGKKYLLEKLPINNFRIPFIRQIFPDARFIHIYRNGLEVAQSIEELAAKGKWFGPDSYKWETLLKLAKAQDEFNFKGVNLENMSLYERGLMEWRLSTQIVRESLQKIPSDSYIEISYEDFVNSPMPTIGEILSFLNVDSNADVLNFVKTNVKRKSPTKKIATASETEKNIIGEQLIYLCN